MPGRPSSGSSSSSGEGGSSSPSPAANHGSPQKQQQQQQRREEEEEEEEGEEGEREQRRREDQQQQQQQEEEEEEEEEEGGEHPLRRRQRRRQRQQEPPSPPPAAPGQPQPPSRPPEAPGPAEHPPPAASFLRRPFSRPPWALNGEAEVEAGLGLGAAPPEEHQETRLYETLRGPGLSPSSPAPAPRPPLPTPGTPAPAPGRMDEPPPGPGPSPSLLLLRIGIPDLQQTKCLRLNPDVPVWVSKQRILCTLNHSLKDVLNYGLFQPAFNGRAGKFLDEERLLREYPLNPDTPVPYLEFRYKRRVYTQSRWMTSSLPSCTPSAAPQRSSLQTYSGPKGVPKGRPTEQELQQSNLGGNPDHSSLDMGINRLAFPFGPMDGCGISTRLLAETELALPAFFITLCPTAQDQSSFPAATDAHNLRQATDKYSCDGLPCDMATPRTGFKSFKLPFGYSHACKLPGDVVGSLLGFRYKRRVYTQSLLDDKQFAKLHTKFCFPGSHMERVAVILLLCPSPSCALQ
ncbi:protein ALEX-like [Sceloporus undulatus]|uniref:protein ALEX-like n=1 Tax=Sceloporus undulatus TaxID=8520 RepID=UPI001C4D5EEE|nr:protein ALEX-like [Sceloporus undulatus]